MNPHQTYGADLNKLVSSVVFLVFQIDLVAAATDAALPLPPLLSSNFLAKLSV